MATYRQTIPPPGDRLITVNKQNILEAARLVQDALDNEGKTILDQLNNLHINPFAQDLVSVQLAQEWNRRVVTDPDSFVNQVRDYMDTLKKALGQLHDQMNEYDRTENQIADSFHPGGHGG